MGRNSQAVQGGDHFLFMKTVLHAFTIVFGLLTVAATLATRNRSAPSTSPPRNEPPKVRLANASTPSVPAWRRRRAHWRPIPRWRKPLGCARKPWRTARLRA